MGSVLGQILPYAVGIAITPTAIIAVILMLFSARPAQNGLSFLAGWLIAMTVVLLVVLGASSTGGASAGTPSTLVSIVLAGLGVLLVALGVKSFQGRPEPGSSAPMPKWMASIDSIKPGRAFLVGALYTSVSPKSLALIVAAGLAIAQAGLEVREETVAVIEFVLIGSLTILFPVLYSLLGGESARTRLDGWKSWLAANNATVVAVILVLLGVVLIGDGLGPLID
jgi:hypothetical protein